VASAHDIVISAETSFEDAYLLNAACLAHRRPLLCGSAAGLHGEVRVYFGYLSNSPCYACANISRMADSDDDSTTPMFALGSTLIGTLLATEVIKIILGLTDARMGRVIQYDGHTGNVRLINLTKDPQCAACAMGQIAPGASR
jgi:molybdopterin-synthase adenylyltransferase